MRTARPLGLSADGRLLIVAVDGDDEELAIPADERLRAALRNDRPRLGQLEIDMDSALRPRDIQARIRAGESLEEVAQAAGVPVDRIEPFAAPVIAEREHIAGLAQTNPVRRAGDAVAHRNLRTVITERLLSRGVDVDSVQWDAWRNPDRRWTVRLAYESGSAQREAEFTYDQAGRFSVAANEDARWLTGEHSSSHGPQPGRRSPGEADDATERPDLDDELAIVRAIQPQFEVTPDIDDDDEVDAGTDDGTDNEDAFAEGELAEVDGVLDIVPGDRSNLDVLYDMLSSFDEDSVQIYAGLVRPRPEQAPGPVLDEGPGEDTATYQEIVSVEHVVMVTAEPVEAPETESSELDDDVSAPPEVAEATDLEAAEEAEPAPEQPSAEAGTAPSDEVADEAPADEAVITEPEDVELDFGDPEEQPDATDQQPQAAEPEQAPSEEQQPAAAVDTVDDEPAVVDEPAAAEEPTSEPEARPAGKPGKLRPAEPEQPSLVDESGNEPSRPVKRKRASVPSWDEIMFGSPKPKQ